MGARSGADKADHCRALFPIGVGGSVFGSPEPNVVEEGTLILDGLGQVGLEGVVEGNGKVKEETPVVLEGEDRDARENPHCRFSKRVGCWNESAEVARPGVCGRRVDRGMVRKMELGWDQGCVWASNKLGGMVRHPILKQEAGGLVKPVSIAEVRGGSGIRGTAESNVVVDLGGTRDLALAGLCSQSFVGQGSLGGLGRVGGGFEGHHVKLDGDGGLFGGVDGNGGLDCPSHRLS